MTGSAQIQWDQAASSASEAASYHYVSFIDNVRMELTGATCATTSAVTGSFVCSARLPKMSPGLHRLQLAAEDGERRVGSKSNVLLINVLPPKTSP